MVLKTSLSWLLPYESNAWEALDVIQPLEIVVYLLCKLFANKLCVSEDGVFLLRPLLTTPDIWRRNTGKKGV